MMIVFATHHQQHHPDIRELSLVHFTNNEMKDLPITSLFPLHITIVWSFTVCAAALYTHNVSYAFYLFQINSCVIFFFFCYLFLLFFSIVYVCISICCCMASTTRELNRISTQIYVFCLFLHANI